MTIKSLHNECQPISGRRFVKFFYPQKLSTTFSIGHNVNLLPNGAREHTHLRPKSDLGMNSESVVIGRLDAKGTGAFYDSYIPKNI